MMTQTRFLLILASVTMIAVLHSPAEAFLGLGAGRDGGSSGLDLVMGYDRNTVSTITGRIAVIPDPADDPVTIEITSGTDRFVVVVGPRWYLQDDNLAWKAGETITVRGSKAQGKDGRSYLLAQWLTTSSTGQLVLRNGAGSPSWSGGTRTGQQGGGAVQTQRGGAGGYRGGK